MEMLNRYFALQKKIYDYFGYVEDWVRIPLNDETESYWMLHQEENGRGFVVYSPEPLTKELIEGGGKFYSDVIYTQRFLPKWVYVGKDYTMVCVDTRTDGNKFLSVFDNKKKIEDASLLAIYKEHWG